MKSLRILAILCLICGVCLESTNAQIPHIMNYNLSSESTIKSVGIWDTSFSQKSIPLSTNRNFNDLIKIPILFNDKGVGLTSKSATMRGSGNSVTFNGKWESLTGKPIIDTSRVYYSPLQRTNNPTFSDNNFYRTTANIFNFFINTKYPSLNAHK